MPVDTEQAQRTVYASVCVRGYRHGWGAKEYMARQVVKLFEEIAELADLILPPASELSRDIQLVSEVARDRFDNAPKEFWKQCALRFDARGLVPIKREAADVLIVLYNLASAIGEAEGRHFFNVATYAMEKSAEDVKRGVR